MVVVKSVVKVMVLKEVAMVVVKVVNTCTPMPPPPRPCPPLAPGLA